jgi:integrase
MLESIQLRIWGVYMLTDKLVKSLKPAKGLHIEKDRQPGDPADKTLPGFGLRITPNGAKAFVFRYRAAGVERLYTIGSFPSWTTVRARAEGRNLRVLVDQGGDPHAEREAARTAPTVKQLADRYVADVMPRKAPGTQDGDMSMLRGWILPALGNRKVASLRPSDVEGLHAKVTRSGARTRANRTIGLLSAMLSAAVRWEYVERNVAKGAIQRNPEVSRRRYLSGAEIQKLSDALSCIASRDAADAVRLLLLTGGRKTEIVGMRWAELNLEAGVWRKPADRTKQGRPHDAPLSAPALEILARLRETATTEFVFPAKSRAGHADIRGTWRRVRVAAGIEDVRLHDLRHSFASILVSSGASLPLIGALLGHSNPATTARYSHLFLDPQRAAVEKVGKIVAGGPSAEVVPLKSKQQR